MPRQSAKTVAVEFTLQELQLMRNLIYCEARALGYSKYQRLVEMPGRLRRLGKLNAKIVTARAALKKEA